MKLLQPLLKLFPTQDYLTHLTHSLIRTPTLGLPLYLWLLLLTHALTLSLSTLVFVLFSHHAQRAVLTHCALLALPSRCAQLANGYTSQITHWGVAYLLSFRQLRFFLHETCRRQTNSFLADFAQFEVGQMFLVFGANVVFSLAEKCALLWEMDAVTYFVLRLLLLSKAVTHARLSPSFAASCAPSDEKTDACFLYAKQEKLKFVTCNGLRLYCKDDFD